MTANTVMTYIVTNIVQCNIMTIKKNNSEMMITFTITVNTSKTNTRRNYAPNTLLTNTIQ